ncbi:MAG: helix-turn-helix transcriptional regulator [Clostridia bacterium]|nr:helix-turn-helix transcriptional regulator [Clostridia bacterium]
MKDHLLNVYTVLSVPGRREFYPHHHTELEIAWFRSGRGTYTVTGREYNIGAGDIFLFSNNEIHKITWVDPSIPMEALNIHFQPRLLLSQSEHTGLNLSRLFFNRCPGFDNRLDSETLGEAGDEIRQALSSVEREAAGDKLGSDVLAQIHLTHALVLMLRLIDYFPEAAPPGSLSSISTALSYIDENFRSDIRLDELCSLANMSRSNFERVFVLLAGMTVSEYTKRRRIDHAVKLLRTTNMTVLEIALASGYHNTANFNKQFRVVTGKTPKDVRRERIG